MPYQTSHVLNVHNASLCSFKPISLTHSGKRFHIHFQSGIKLARNKYMKPNIGLSPKNLNAITGILNGVLADAVLLYTKTRKFHWNVSGNSFMELHKLFEKHYKQLEASIDEIAERINKLGANTPGTMLEFLKMATLKESPGKYPSQDQML